MLCDDLTGKWGTVDSLPWIRHKEAATLSEKSKTGEQYKFFVGAGLESGKTEVGGPFHYPRKLLLFGGHSPK